MDYDAQAPMLSTPPECWLYLQAGFAAQYLPPGSEGTVADVFPFPSMDGDVPRGDRRRRDGVRVHRPAGGTGGRAVLLSPEFGDEMAKPATGMLMANRRFDLDHHSPFVRRQAALLQAALAEGVYRFDASDVMPPEIGAGLFWDAMVRYLTEGRRASTGS